MRSGSEVRFWRKVQVCTHVTVPLGEHYYRCASCCWLWLGARTDKGYGRTRYVFDGGEEIYVSRVAWAFAHHGVAPPRDREVAHTCDHPPCSNPSHLWLATHAENMADRDRKGRGKGGGRPLKLTWDKVACIQTLAKAGCSQREIARVIGISQPMVSYILTGQAWKMH